MLSQQDENRLNKWFEQLHVLVEGLQAQVNELKGQVAELKQPLKVEARKPVKEVKTVEEPVTEVK